MGNLEEWKDPKKSGITDLEPIARLRGSGTLEQIIERGTRGAAQSPSLNENKQDSRRSDRKSGGSSKRLERGANAPEPPPIPTEEEIEFVRMLLTPTVKQPDVTKVSSRLSNFAEEDEHASVSKRSHAGCGH